MRVDLRAIKLQHERGDELSKDLQICSLSFALFPVYLWSRHGVAAVLVPINKGIKLRLPQSVTWMWV